MTITSELLGKIGGGEVETVSVGQVTDTDVVIYSFTLDKTSIVSAALTGTEEQEGSEVRWGEPAPTVEVRPPGGGVWGETQFRSSLFVYDSSSRVPPEAQAGNNRYLSISAVLPSGNYEIVVNSQRRRRDLTVSTATIAITPL